MWKELNIFFWPLYDFLSPKADKAVETLSPNNFGTYFNDPKIVPSEINIDIVKGFFLNPYIYISEIVGVLILLYFGIKLLRGRK